MNVFPVEQVDSLLRVGETGRRKLFSMSVQKKDQDQVNQLNQQEVDCDESPKMTILSIEMYQSNHPTNNTGGVKKLELIHLGEDEDHLDMFSGASLNRRQHRDDYIISLEESIKIKGLGGTQQQIKFTPRFENNMEASHELNAENMGVQQYFESSKCDGLIDSGRKYKSEIGGKDELDLDYEAMANRLDLGLLDAGSLTPVSNFEQVKQMPERDEFSSQGHT